MELGGGEELQSPVPRGSNLWVAHGDVKNWCYQCGLPSWLYVFFVDMALSSQATKDIEDQVISGDSCGHPRLIEPPLGWSWASWAVQTLHLRFSLCWTAPVGGGLAPLLTGDSLGAVVLRQPLHHGE